MCSIAVEDPQMQVHPHEQMQCQAIVETEQLCIQPVTAVWLKQTRYGLESISRM